MNAKVGKILLSLSLVGTLSGCYTSAGGFADQLNPYAEATTELGERNTNALGGGGSAKNAAEARHALEVMGTYRRAQAPQPYYPVVKPAEIRLMWIPDHINRLGDLVPAHYYYLRVLREDFEVQDAFEVERQINSRVPTGYSGGGGAQVVGAPASGAPAGGDTISPNLFGGATPWQYKEQK